MLKHMRFAVLALAALLVTGESDARALFKRVCIESTADASGNSRTAYAIGVKPDVVAAGLAGLSFDGIDRDDQSSGLSAGVTGFGVQTSDGSMQVKATIRLAATGTFIIAGKSDNFTSSAVNYLFYIASGVLNFHMKRNDGATITAVGTTTLATNTNYNVQADWTGAVLDVAICSPAPCTPTQEGTTPALTTLQSPDSTTPLTIARTTFNTGDPGNPYPFQGTIANVSMTKGGVVQGQWAMTSVSCPTSANDDEYWPQLERRAA